jgi:hypothetical protein
MTWGIDKSLGKTLNSIGYAIATDCDADVLSLSIPSTYALNNSGPHSALTSSGKQIKEYQPSQPHSPSRVEITASSCLFVKIHQSIPYVIHILANWRIMLSPHYHRTAATFVLC